MSRLLISYKAVVSNPNFINSLPWKTLVQIADTDTTWSQVMVTRLCMWSCEAVSRYLLCLVRENNISSNCHQTAQLSSLENNDTPLLPTNNTSQLNNFCYTPTINHLPSHCSTGTNNNVHICTTNSINICLICCEDMQKYDKDMWQTYFIEIFEPSFLYFTWISKNSPQNI